MNCKDEFYDTNFEKIQYVNVTFMVAIINIFVFLQYNFFLSIYMELIRNNITIGTIFLKSLSFWDKRLFDMVSEPL
jgi:hypothetical protein